MDTNRLKMILFSVSDILAIVGIFVNIGLAVYLTLFIQRNQINSRTLKDYYISQTDKMSAELHKFLDALDSEKIRPKNVRNEFITIVAQTNNLCESVNMRYKVDCNVIIVDLLALQQNIENDTAFQRNYRRNKQGWLTNTSIDEVRAFRSTKIKFIHQMITSINDYA